MFDIQELSLDIEKETEEISAKRLFFDIESGLSYSTDILQLAYILTDWNFNIQEVYSEYFRNINTIEEDSIKIHGLTQEFLWKNASTYFITRLPELPFYSDVALQFITYSLYDISKIKNVIHKHKLNDIDFGIATSSLMQVPVDRNYFDAFILGNRSLVNSSSEEVKLKAKVMCTNYFGEDRKEHDALYDTALMFYLCRGVVLGEKYN